MLSLHANQRGPEQVVTKTPWGPPHNPESPHTTMLNNNSVVYDAASLAPQSPDLDCGAMAGRYVSKRSCPSQLGADTVITVPNSETNNLVANPAWLAEVRKKGEMVGRYGMYVDQNTRATQA